MKKLLWLALLLAFLPNAHAGTCSSLSSGASQNTISSALTNCSSAGGGTVTFAAGTYGPITSAVTIPCGVSMSGPSVPYSQTPNQTATIQGSSSSAAFWGFETTAGCSEPQTIEYLGWNGEQPSNGGGFLNIVPGTTNLTVQNDWLHGVNAPGADNGGQNNQADLIFFSGGSTGAVTNNVTIQNNVFGSTSFGDCGTVMKDTSNGENDNGGLCGGVGIHNNVTNVSVIRNIFHWLEEPIKTFEGQGQCNPLTISYNSVSNYSRIGYETQCNIGTSSQPTLMYIQYNNFGTRYNTLQTFDISAANGCANAVGGDCATHTDYNVDLQAATGASDVGIEIWGQTASGGSPATTANYNLLQGYLYDGITWSQSGQFTFNDNTFNVVNNGTNTNCDTGSGGYWDKEAPNNPAYSPSCTGNTFSNAITGTYSSAPPTLSPASGSFSGSQVVTITNTGTNRDTNTTDWCTTDESTPTPGSGTAVAYYKGGTLTVTSTTTVKCVGMWGAPNQPYSYPSGYGYVASSVVSNTYTSGGNPTITGGYLGNPGSVNTVPVNAGPIQFTAYATYSDGKTRTLPDAYGNIAVWSSSNSSILTVGSTGLVSCIASGKANVQVNVNTSSGLRLNVWTMTCTLPADPTITGGYLGDPGSVNTLAVGAAAIQFTAYGVYSDGNTRTLPDAYGNTAVWSSSNSSILAVGSTGLVSCIATGIANVQVNVNTSSGLRLNVWTMTCH